MGLLVRRKKVFMFLPSILGTWPSLVKGQSDEVLTVFCTSARPPPLFRWSALFHGLIVLQKMTLFDWLKRHRGDKYSTKETCLTTFIRDMHAVGFHDDAGCFCSDFGLYTMFFGKLDASEIGTKWGPIREEQLDPESIISGWSALRLQWFPTRLCRGHTNPPARFTAGTLHRETIQDHPNHTILIWVIISLMLWLLAAEH